MSEPTYGASFRRDLDCWVVYEGNGEEELCRCGHDKVGVLLTALRRPPARFTREDVEKVAIGMFNLRQGQRGTPDITFDQCVMLRDDWLALATAALSAIGDVGNG